MQVPQHLTLVITDDYIDEGIRLAAEGIASRSMFCPVSLAARAALGYRVASSAMGGIEVHGGDWPTYPATPQLSAFIDAFDQHVANGSLVPRPAPVTLELTLVDA